jgi:hypothetical protein
LSSTNRLVTRRELLSVFREATPGALVPIRNQIDALLVQVNTNPAFKPFRETILSGGLLSIVVNGDMAANSGSYVFSTLDPSRGQISVSSIHKTPESLGGAIIQEFHHREYSKSDFSRSMAAGLSWIVNSNLSPAELAIAKATFTYVDKIHNEVLSEIKELIYWNNVITARFQSLPGNVSSNVDLAFARREYIALAQNNNEPRIALFDKVFPLILAQQTSDGNLAPLYLKQGWEVFSTNYFFQNRYLIDNAITALDRFRNDPQNGDFGNLLTLEKLLSVKFKRQAEDDSLLLMPEGFANQEGTVFNVITENTNKSLQFEFQNGKFLLVIFDRGTGGEWVGVGYDGASQTIVFTSTVGFTADGSRTENRAYVNGKTEVILFNETGLEFSRTSTGTTNGQPYERVEYADGRVAQAIFNTSGIKTGTSITETIGIDTSVRYLNATGAWQYTVTTQPDDNGFQTRTTETPSGRNTVELLQLADPNNPLSARTVVNSSILYKESNGAVSVTERYNASNELISIERSGQRVLANGQQGTQQIVINAATREQITTVTARDGTVVSTETTRTFTPADNQRLSSLVSGLGDLNGAYNQWRAGNRLQGAIQLSSGTVNIIQATGGTELRQSLGGIGASLGAINQLLNLDQVFSSGGNEELNLDGLEFLKTDLILGRMRATNVGGNYAK